MDPQQFKTEAAPFTDAVRSSSPTSPPPQDDHGEGSTRTSQPSALGTSSSERSSAGEAALAPLLTDRTDEYDKANQEESDPRPSRHPHQPQHTSALSSSCSSSLFATSWPFVGRDEELETIRSVYRRVVASSATLSPSASSSHSQSQSQPIICEFVVVEGPPGSGKTGLVREALHQGVPTMLGYLCEGQFDPFQRRRSRRGADPPHAALVDAMDGFVTAVLRRGGNEVKRVARCLSNALGEDRAALIEMVPSTRALFLRSDEEEEEEEEEAAETGEPSPPESGAIQVPTSSVHDDPSVSSSALADLMSRTDLNRNHGSSSSSGGQMNKFKHVVRRFLRAVASPDHPLVLLLDDVQWADETSLDVLWSLLSENENNPGLLVVATYRVDDSDNNKPINNGEGCDPDDPTARVWTKLQQEKSRVNVTLVKVPNLDLVEVERLVASVLGPQGGRDRGTTTNSVAGLSSMLHECTRGNPLLIRENLMHLRDLGLFAYNEMLGIWTWDSEEVRVELASSLSKVVRQRILALPSMDIETLKVASCFGATIDEELMIRVISEPFLLGLGRAVECGLLAVDPTSRKYRFAHHQVRAEAYELILVEERAKLHCRLGRKLWESLNPSEVEKFMFPVIGQFLQGNHEYVSLRERKEIALLLARAGERAMVMSSFPSAYSFLSAAIDCLGEGRWRDSYTLCLNLHNAAAEIACCIGMYSDSETLVFSVIKHARSLDDTYRAQSTRIYSLGGRNRLLEAISVGLNALKTLGVTFPSNPTRFYVWKQFMSMKLTLRRKYTYQSILRLPIMTDRRSLAASQVLNLLYLYTTSARPELAPLVGFALMRLTLKAGLCPLSCVGFVTFAMCLCSFGNDIDTGYEYGQVSLKMYEMFKGETWLVRLTAGYYGCVHPWKKPLHETWPPLKRAHQVGLESGDIEFSMLCISMYAWGRFDYGPLTTIESEIRDAADLMNQHGQLASRDNIKGVWQASLNLMGHGVTGNLWELNGEVLSPQDVAEWKTKNYTLFIWAHHYEMVVCYIFCRYGEAAIASEQCHSFIDHTLGSVDVGSVVLFAGLSNLAMERMSPKRGQRNRIRKYLQKIRYWAKHSPYNFLGMQFLLEGELASVRGDNDSALSKFVCAIALNREVGSLQRAALSTERLGRHLMNLGQISEGRGYLDESMKLYEEYGALAKVRHLQIELSVEESPSG